jgi:hypothetical protein
MMNNYIFRMERLTQSGIRAFQRRTIRAHGSQGLSLISVDTMGEPPDCKLGMRLEVAGGSDPIPPTLCQCDDRIRTRLACAMAGSGHSRQSRASSKTGDVRFDAESGIKR